ncbi:hypothetical protein B9J07_18070 [Sinorhizobium sp. LM21]|nr:hypothetical protein B9J07_18070 [Sinorhizobium sp. LM21]
MESKAGIGLGQTASRSARFLLADEPGMTLSELNDAPKVQRHFQPSEFHELFAEHFEEVSIGVHINNVTAICRRPRPIDAQRLRAAIEFEFDLPYAEGRMGFVDKALQAFSQRLGVTLSPIGPSTVSRRNLTSTCGSIWPGMTSPPTR